MKGKLKYPHLSRKCKLHFHRMCGAPRTFHSIKGILINLQWSLSHSRYLWIRDLSLIDFSSMRPLQNVGISLCSLCLSKKVYLCITSSLEVIYCICEITKLFLFKCVMFLWSEWVCHFVQRGCHLLRSWSLRSYDLHWICHF